MASEIFESLTFLSELTEDDQQYLLKNVLIKEIELSGSTMNPNSCDGLIVLQSGRLRVFMTSQNGKEITLYHLLPKDICVLSYGCKIGKMPFNIQVTAIEKSTVYNIPSSVLNELQEKYQTIKEFLLTETTERLTDVMGVVEKVAFSSLDSRLADLLLSQNTSVIYKTHAEFASDLGSSREIISRLLKTFEQDGFLELSRGKIKLIDIDKLAALI